MNSLERRLADLERSVGVDDAPRERVILYIPDNGRDPDRAPSAPDDAVQVYEINRAPWEEDPLCP